MRDDITMMNGLGIYRSQGDLSRNGMSLCDAPFNYINSNFFSLNIYL
jgi:hypothetical protein